MSNSRTRKQAERPASPQPLTQAHRTKRFVIYTGSFLLGALAVIVPMFIRASIIHAGETARHEQTMAPGITIFMGLLLAPLGGLLAIAIVVFVRRVRGSASWCMP